MGCTGSKATAIHPSDVPEHTGRKPAPTIVSPTGVEAMGPLGTRVDSDDSAFGGEHDTRVAAHFQAASNGSSKPIEGAGAVPASAGNGSVTDKAGKWALRAASMAESAFQLVQRESSRRDSISAMQQSVQRLNGAMGALVRECITSAEIGELQHVIPCFDARLLLAITTSAQVESATQPDLDVNKTPAAVDIDSEKSGLMAQCLGIYAISQYLTARTRALGGLELPPERNSVAMELRSLQARLARNVEDRFTARMKQFANGVRRHFPVGTADHNYPRGEHAAVDWFSLVTELARFVNSTAQSDQISTVVAGAASAEVSYLLGDVVANVQQLLAADHPALEIIMRFHLEFVIAVRSNWRPFMEQCNILSEHPSSAQTSFEEGHMQRQFGQCIALINKLMAEASLPRPPKPIKTIEEADVYVGRYTTFIERMTSFSQITAAFPALRSILFCTGRVCVVLGALLIRNQNEKQLRAFAKVLYAIQGFMEARLPSGLWQPMLKPVRDSFDVWGLPLDALDAMCERSGSQGGAAAVEVYLQILKHRKDVPSAEKKRLHAILDSQPHIDSHSLSGYDFVDELELEAEEDLTSWIQANGEAAIFYYISKQL